MISQIVSFSPPVCITGLQTTNFPTALVRVAERRGREQIVPGPQAVKGLITPNTAGSGGPHNAKQESRLSPFTLGPQKSLGAPGTG